MEQVTSRIFAETKVRGCNPSFVTTSEGVVVIDTPQLPTRAVAMRKAAERSVDGLWNAIGKLLDLFPPAECANYLAAAGYDAT